MMAVLWCGSGGVNESKRIVKGVSIFIPILRVIQKSIEEIVGRFFRQSTCFHALPNDHRVVWIGGHEAAEGGGVIAGAEVVEAGFGVAFLAGEVARAGVKVGIVTAAEAIAEGEASEGPIVVRNRDVSEVCTEAFGAEPIGVRKVCVAVVVGTEMALASENLTAAADAGGVRHRLTDPPAG